MLQTQDDESLEEWRGQLHDVFLLEAKPQRKSLPSIWLYSHYLAKFIQ